MLQNYENYYALAPFIRNGDITIHSDDITNETWNGYYYGALNIMKDGIETEFVQKGKLTVVFPNGKRCRLTIIDLYFNLIMWHMLVRVGNRIESQYLFFNEATTGNAIKNFIDNFSIMPNRETVDFKLLNNAIDDALHYYLDVDNFSLFLTSTINLEDFVNLMLASPKFNELMHKDLSDVPIEDVKDVGMQVTHEAVDIIKESKSIMGYEHCLADSIRAQEGINIKQFKEFAFSIGSKPDGRGGAHPVAINRSYLNGGLDETIYQFIDSSASRYAQIITKNNVSDSGDFARIVGLNSIDSIIRDDPQYSCNTKNFLEVTITNKEMLRRYTDRWYRFDPEGVEHLLTVNDTHLIGRTLYFRSPMFCASAASGNGICFKCYGMLAYNNRHINAGKMAAEIFTALTTQERLSSKHLLETKIRKLAWNENFSRFIDISSNLLTINKDYPIDREWYLMIRRDDILLENDVDYDQPDYNEDGDPSEDSDLDDTSYNEYVTRFFITNDLGEVFEIKGTEEEPYHMYISNTLNQLIRAKATKVDDESFKVNFDCLDDVGLFYIKIENDDLGKSLDDIQALMDKKDVTAQHTAHSLAQSINNAAIEGKLNVMAIHFEVMLMNQIRNALSTIRKPDWTNKNEPYQLLTLKKALLHNPSVTVSLLFKNLGSLLMSPLTYKKNAPSFMDVFFMREPQNFMSDTHNIVDTGTKDEMVSPITRIRRKNKK